MSITNREGSSGGSMSLGSFADPVSLYDGLVLLANAVELDGRVAWYPPSVRGFASINAYLLIEGKDAVMVDTGVTFHREAVIGQLQAALPGERISIAFTRIGEYAAICNTMAIAERVPVEALYAMVPRAIDWVEFRLRADRPGNGWAIGHPPDNRIAGHADGIPIGSGGRRVHPMPTPVRLLPSQWLYDDGTRTLFTGDAFSHAWRESPDGPWVVDDTARGIDPEGVAEHLFARCWWIPGAKRKTEIQRGIESVFETYDVETIAPGFGCVIHGHRAVERHYEMLQAAISGSDGGGGS